MRTNRSLWTLLPVAAIAAMASGCATVRSMPLGQKVPLDTGRESVALMTVKTANEFKPGWQPKVLAVFVREATGEKKVYSFRVHDPDRHVDEQFNEYLISIGLPPGEYTLIEIRGLNQKFPISAVSSIPMYTSFELKPNSMIYLGRVEAVIHQRKDDSELRAGPVIPLIDQAGPGFRGGRSTSRFWTTTTPTWPSSVRRIRRWRSSRWTGPSCPRGKSPRTRT